MEIIMFSKTLKKIKTFLAEESTLEERVESYNDDISHYRWLAIAFAISCSYTMICSFMFPTYIPAWFPFSESTWFALRNAWFIHLSLMLLNTCLWLRAVVKKNKLLKIVDLIVNKQ